MTPDEDLRAALDSGDPAHIAAATAAVDAADTPKPAVSLHSAALYYASIGLRVFPLQPGTKIPFKGSAGFKDASVNPDVINGWWTDSPDANIGIATGHLVDVVDIDGPLGQKSRATHWDDIFGKIDDESLAKILTPRPGGMHLYVPAQGDGNSGAIFPGVDYRGLGGYVVAPPSVLDDRPGQHPGTYRFLGTPHLADMAKEGAA